MNNRHSHPFLPIRAPPVLPARTKLRRLIPRRLGRNGVDRVEYGSELGQGKRLVQVGRQHPFVLGFLGDFGLRAGLALDVDGFDLFVGVDVEALGGEAADESSW